MNLGGHTLFGQMRCLWVILEMLEKQEPIFIIFKANIYPEMVI